MSAVTVVKDGVITFNCFFIELAWKNNRKNISCIPTGTYTCVKRKAGENGSRFNYEHVEVLDVPNRSAIKWHWANHYHDLLGCMGPGKYANHDIDKDGEIDVVDSRNTLSKLLAKLPQRFELHIMDKPGLL
jgi:hypothetical protein